MMLYAREKTSSKSMAQRKLVMIKVGHIVSPMEVSKCPEIALPHNLMALALLH
jgi:hypothetical protein